MATASLGPMKTHNDFLALGELERKEEERGETNHKKAMDCKVDMLQPRSLIFLMTRPLPVPRSSFPISDHHGSTCTHINESKTTIGIGNDVRDLRHYEISNMDSFVVVGTEWSVLCWPPRKANEKKIAWKVGESGRVLLGRGGVWQTEHLWTSKSTRETIVTKLDNKGVNPHLRVRSLCFHYVVDPHASVKGLRTIIVGNIQCLLSILTTDLYAEERRVYAEERPLPWPLLLNVLVFVKASAIETLWESDMRDDAALFRFAHDSLSEKSGETVIETVRSSVPEKYDSERESFIKEFCFVLL